jgi:hypothetical protein
MRLRIKNDYWIIKQNVGASRSGPMGDTISALFLEGLCTGLNNLIHQNWTLGPDFNLRSPVYKAEY